MGEQTVRERAPGRPGIPHRFGRPTALRDSQDPRETRVIPYTRSALPAAGRIMLPLEVMIDPASTSRMNILADPARFQRQDRQRAARIEASLLNTIVAPWAQRRNKSWMRFATLPEGVDSIQQNSLACRCDVRVRNEEPSMWRSSRDASECMVPWSRIAACGCH